MKHVSNLDINVLLIFCFAVFHRSSCRKVYLKAFGSITVISLMLVLMVFSAISQIMSTLWLAKWTSGKEEDQERNVLIYFFISVSTSLSNCVQAILLTVCIGGLTYHSQGNAAEDPGCTHVVFRFFAHGESVESISAGLAKHRQLCSQ